VSQTVAPTALIETRGTSFELAAFVVGAVFDRTGTRAAFALGDGSLRVAETSAPSALQNYMLHDGAVLALAADVRSGFLSGGDDGKFLRLGEDGTVRELAAFGSKWVEQVACFADGKAGVLACAAGKNVHLFDASGEKLKALEHPSTVTGIAFDGKGKRVAASHYNGATLWFVGSKTDTGRRLEWKGSHIGVAVHPAAEAVVTSMQENALHGWRLADSHDMQMSGYPSKSESIGFTRSGKYLASSGADAIVLWPFFGGGPMGKPPLELAQLPNILCTRVACHPVEDVVAAGYADGQVLLADITTKRVLRVASPGHGPVTALAWSGNGAWLALGTESGFAALVDFNRKEKP
jgi:WD40 repeat protein